MLINAGKSTLNGFQPLFQRDEVLCFKSTHNAKQNKKKELNEMKIFFFKFISLQKNAMKQNSIKNFVM